MQNDRKSLFVSIVGKPNVGKSSMLNMIVNSKISIVSPKPQTTRNKITGILTQDNIQLVFTDTPGLLNPRSRLGNYMVSEINNSFSGCEACIHVVEAGKSICNADLKLMDKFRKMKIPIILVINKIDLLKDKSVIMEQIKDYTDKFEYFAVVPISAKSGNGREELIKELSNLAEPSVFFFDEDDITDQTERVLVSEVIREKMLHLLDKELPHGVAVFIEYFHERDDGMADISAVIYCERENHKAIIIGKGGRMLKNIGTLARKELEEMLMKKINLKLWVKVKENWKNKESVLSDLGYCIDKK